MGDIYRPDPNEINVGSISQEINDSTTIEVGSEYYKGGFNDEE